jgi:hypothetical protein
MNGWISIPGMDSDFFFESYAHGLWDTLNRSCGHLGHFPKLEITGIWRWSFTSIYVSRPEMRGDLPPYTLHIFCHLGLRHRGNLFVYIL